MDKIIANDLSDDAVANIRRNVLYNKIDPATGVIPNKADAQLLMHQVRNHVPRGKEKRGWSSFSGGHFPWCQVRRTYDAPA